MKAHVFVHPDIDPGKLKEIKKYRVKHFRALVIAREQIEVLKTKVESMHKLMSGNDFFILQGWVPKSMTIELSKLMFEATEGHSVVDFDKPKKEQEDVPVKLTNPKWLQPFEMLTELYALQLHELEQEEYLETKRKERSNQVQLQQQLNSKNEAVDYME